MKVRRNPEGAAGLEMGGEVDEVHLLVNDPSKHLSLVNGHNHPFGRSLSPL